MNYNNSYSWVIPGLLVSMIIVILGITIYLWYCEIPLIETYINILTNFKGLLFLVSLFVFFIALNLNNKL